MNTRVFAVGSELKAAARQSHLVLFFPDILSGELMKYKVQKSTQIESCQEPGRGDQVQRGDFNDRMEPLPAAERVGQHLSNRKK